MKSIHKKKKTFLLVSVAALFIYLGCVLFVRTSYKLESINKLNSPVSTSTESLPMERINTRITNEKYYVSSIDIPLDNMSVGGRVVAEYQKWLSETGVLDIKTKEAADKIGLSDTRKYEYEAKLKIYENEKYTSYVYEILNETGGAHPNTYHTIFNYRKSDGKEIVSISDLYVDSVYETLSKLSRSDLRTQFMATGNSADTLDDMMGEMFMSGTEAKAENFTRFYFKDKNTLTVVFDKYAIGPYSIGDWDTDISLYSLKSLLR
jgi:hypothetical protein